MRRVAKGNPGAGGGRPPLRKRRILRAALATLLASTPAAWLPAQEPDPGASIVIRGVSVVDVEAGRVIPGRTVTIRGSRIAAVEGLTDPPEGARVIDGGGRFLIPGLWDMHGHALSVTPDPGAAWWEPEYRMALDLLVANGVTGLREMWGSLETMAQVRRERTRTDPAWPRIVAAGAIVDGPEPFHPGLVSLATPEEARWAVDSLVAGGADFIKVYSALPGDLYRELVRYAGEEGVRVAGHVPSAVRAEDAARAGQSSFEHLYGVLEGCSTDEAALVADNVAFLDERAAGRSNAGADRDYFERLLETQSAERCGNLLDLLAALEVWQVPTLAAHRGVFRLREAASADDPRLPYVHPIARSQWRPAGYDETRSFTRADWDLRYARWERMLEVVGEMARRGVPILAGSDFHPTLAFTFPGFGLHEELELLVQAGLSPAEALRAATLNPARYLGATDSLGTVEPGKLADLVLLDRNPLEDIRSIRSVRAVAVNGRWLDRSELDRLLVGVADRYRNSPVPPPMPLPGGADRVETVVGSTAGLRILFLVDPERLKASIPAFLEPLTATEASALDPSLEAFLTVQPAYRSWVLAGLDIAMADSVRIDDGSPSRRAEARWWVEMRSSGLVPDDLPPGVETRVEIDSWRRSRSPGTRVTARRFGSGTWTFGFESMALRVDAVCDPGGARVPVGTPPTGYVLIWQGGEVPDRYTVRTAGSELARDCDLRLSAAGSHPLAAALRESPPVGGSLLGARLVEGAGGRRAVYRVD